MRLRTRMEWLAMGGFEEHATGSEGRHTHTYAGTSSASKVDCEEMIQYGCQDLFITMASGTQFLLLQWHGLKDYFVNEKGEERSERFFAGLGGKNIVPITMVLLLCTFQSQFPFFIDYTIWKFC